MLGTCERRHLRTWAPTQVEAMPTLRTVEALAEVSVARGCGFAALAILTLMVGLSWDLALACMVGGLLVLFVCLVLVAKAQWAHRRPAGKTELWLMLDEFDRPSSAIAQRIVGSVLRACYLRFALHAAGISAGLLALSITLRLAGGEA